jgi:hypothetical protein
MGGSCSSSNIDIYKQEQYVRKNLPRYNLLKSKYSIEQIECKLRQQYHNNGYKKSGTFISQNDWVCARKK